MVRKAAQHRRQTLLEVCSNAFAFLHQGIEDDGSVSCRKSAYEQTILAADCHLSDCSLHLLIMLPHDFE